MFCGMPSTAASSVSMLFATVAKLSRASCSCPCCIAANPARRAETIAFGEAVEPTMPAFNRKEKKTTVKGTQRPIFVLARGMPPKKNGK